MRKGSLVGFGYGALLAVAIVTLVCVGDKWLASVNFPWTLAALLGVALASVLWGSGPAVVVLVVCLIFAELIAPDLNVPFFRAAINPIMRLMRMGLFLSCGGVMIFLSHQMSRHRRRSEQQAGVVRAFQAMMLPQELPRIPGYSVSCRYIPAREEEQVGGDFFDVFPLPGGSRFMLFIGDVAGKGKEAAISIALIRYSMRAYGTAQMSPAEILARTNDLLISSKENDRAATAFVAVLDFHSGKLEFANAGHELPLVVDANGAVRDLASTGMMLGVAPEETYENCTETIAPGESLLMMTDGVTEARNPQGVFLNAEGAARLLQRAATRPVAHEILDRIDRSLSLYVSSPFRDDVAMLLLCRNAANRKLGKHAQTAPARPRELSQT